LNGTYQNGIRDAQIEALKVGLAEIHEKLNNIHTAVMSLPCPINQAKIEMIQDEMEGLKKNNGKNRWNDVYVSWKAVFVYFMSPAVGTAAVLIIKSLLGG